jgi:peptidoglycan/LPS O-acetylase OafA/YrhL
VRRAVRELSRVSFGVFLVHPFVISLLLLSPFGALIARPGQPWQTVLLWIATVLVSIAFALVAARTPLSLPLTGRRVSPRTSRARRRVRADTGTTESAEERKRAPTAAGPTTTGRSS